MNDKKSRLKYLYPDFASYIDSLEEDSLDQFAKDLVSAGEKPKLIQEMQELYPDFATFIAESVATGDKGPHELLMELKEAGVAPAPPPEKTLGEKAKSALTTAKEFYFPPSPITPAVGGTMPPTVLPTPEITPPRTLPEVLSNKVSLLKPDAGLPLSLTAQPERIASLVQGLPESTQGQMGLRSAIPIPELRAGLGTGREIPLPKPKIPEGIYQDIGPTGEAIFNLAGTFLPIGGAAGLGTKAVSAISGAGARQLVPAAKTALDILAGGGIYGAGKAAIEGKGPLETLAESGRESGAWMTFVGGLGIGANLIGRVVTGAGRHLANSAITKQLEKLGIIDAAKAINSGDAKTAEAVIEKIVADSPALSEESVNALRGSYRKLTNNIAKEIKTEKTFDAVKIMEEIKPQVEAKIIPKAKEPWEMTNQEILEAIKKPKDEVKITNNIISMGKGILESEMKVYGIPARKIKGWEKILARHEKDIEQAIKEGKPVPPEVLAEYPELAGKIKPGIAERAEIQNAVSAELAKEQIILSQSSNPVDKALAKISAEVEPEIKQSAQAGYFDMLPKIRLERKQKEINFENTILESAYKKQSKEAKPSSFGNILKSMKEMKDDFGKTYMFEWELRADPALVNQLRIFKDARKESGEFANEAVYKILGPKIAENETAYKAFQRMNFLRDVKENSAQGIESYTVKLFKRELNMLEETTPQEILPIIEKELTSYTNKVMQSGYGESVGKALVRLDEIHRAVAEDLIKRGKLKPEIRFDTYFHHRVMDYIEGRESWFTGVAKKIKEPFRTYTKGRKGTERPISYDWLQTEIRYLQKYKLDNSTDDFIKDIVNKYDVAPELGMEEKLRLFGQKLIRKYREDYKVLGGMTDEELIPKMLADVNYSTKIAALRPELNSNLRPIYKIGDKNYVAWTEKGKLFYEPKSDADKVGQQLIWDFLPEADKLRIQPNMPIRLIPEDIGNRLVKFKDPEKWGEFKKTLWDATSLWKRIVLDFAGIPYQMNNFYGDLMNVYRDDASAFVSGSWLDAIESAWYMAKGKKPGEVPERVRKYVEEAYKQRVASSGIVGVEYAVKPYSDPRFAKLLPGKLNPLAWAANKVEFISAFREDIPRMLKFISDIKRIDRGKGQMPVIPKWINIGNMNPKSYETAGMATRISLIDYGAVSPTFAQDIRGIMFPFATFYLKNGLNWAKYFNQSRKSFSDGALFAGKFLFPNSLMFTWNNSGDRAEIEKIMPEYIKYIPHIITGFKTEDGKPIVLAMQTPLDMSMKLLGGADRLPDALFRLGKGEITGMEFAKEVFTNVYKVPAEQAWRMLNPLPRAGIDLIRNKDSFSKRKIIPDELRGTSEGNRVAVEYFAKQLLSPLAQYERISRMKDIDPVTPIERLALTGPLDIPRGVFGYKTFDPEYWKKEKLRTAPGGLEEKKREAGAVEYLLEEKYSDILAKYGYRFGSSIPPQAIAEMKDSVDKMRERSPEGAIYFQQMSKIEQLKIFKNALEKQYAKEGNRDNKRVINIQIKKIRDIVDIIHLQQDKKMFRPGELEVYQESQNIPQMPVMQSPYGLLEGR